MVVLKQTMECPAQGLVFPQALTVLEKPKCELQSVKTPPLEEATITVSK